MIQRVIACEWVLIPRDLVLRAQMEAVILAYPAEQEQRFGPAGRRLEMIAGADETFFDQSGRRRRYLTLRVPARTAPFARRKPRLATTPWPVGSPSARRPPGVGTDTRLASRPARHTLESDRALGACGLAHRNY